jgi:tetratricopeptide (TPR) repeat protein
MDSAHLRDKEQEKILSLRCVDACKTFGLENTPEYVDSLIALGDYYRLHKGLAKAINYYKESIDLYRDHAELHINPKVRQDLGLCYFASENWAKAEESFKGYLQENPAGGKAVVNYLIVALMKQHKESEATRLKSQYSI